MLTMPIGLIIKKRYRVVELRSVTLLGLELSEWVPNYYGQALNLRMIHLRA